MIADEELARIEQGFADHPPGECPRCGSSWAWNGLNGWTVAYQTGHLATVEYADPLDFCPLCGLDMLEASAARGAGRGAGES